MNAKSFVTFATLTVFASLACSAIALADSTTDETCLPESGSVNQCEIRGNDFRCLNRDVGTKACVRIRNRSADTVSFWYDEWHSICGLPGVKVFSQKYNLRSTERSLIAMKFIPSDMLSLPYPCREGFVLDCRVGGASVTCSAVLTVEHY